MRDWLPLNEEIAAVLASRTRRDPLMRDVLRTVAEVTGVDVDLMLGPRRHHQVAVARHIAMLAMRERCPWASLPRIARTMHRADHTTIMHGCAAAAKRNADSPEHRDMYEAVLLRLDRRASKAPVAEAAE